MLETAVEMEAGDYENAIVRIRAGTGAGQERKILSNTVTTVYVGEAMDDRTWDASSYFAMRLGAGGSARRAVESVAVEIPNHTGEKVEIMGLARTRTLRNHVGGWPRSRGGLSGEGRQW